MEEMVKISETMRGLAKDGSLSRYREKNLIWLTWGNLEENLFILSWL